MKFRSLRNLAEGTLSTIDVFIKIYESIVQ